MCVRHNSDHQVRCSCFSNFNFKHLFVFELVRKEDGIESARTIVLQIHCITNYDHFAVVRSGRIGYQFHSLVGRPIEIGTELINPLFLLFDLLLAFVELDNQLFRLAYLNLLQIHSNLLFELLLATLYYVCQLQDTTVGELWLMALEDGLVDEGVDGCAVLQHHF